MAALVQQQSWKLPIAVVAALKVLRAPAACLKVQVQSEILAGLPPEPLEEAMEASVVVPPEGPLVSSSGKQVPQELPVPLEGVFLADQGQRHPLQRTM